MKEMKKLKRQCIVMIGTSVVVVAMAIFGYAISLDVHVLTLGQRSNRVDAPAHAILTLTEEQVNPEAIAAVWSRVTSDMQDQLEDFTLTFVVLFVAILVMAMGYGHVAWKTLRYIKANEKDSNKRMKVTSL
jgi:hypothetical protein